MSAGVRVYLEVRSGTDAARRLVLDGPTPRTVGRGRSADESFPHDVYMDDVHAAFWIDGDTCRVRDLGSQHGTWVQAERTAERTLRHGEQVQVGGTLFVVLVDPTRIVAATASPLPTGDRTATVLSFLREGPGALFAVLDAARDDQVLPFLHTAGVQFQTLYEGIQGEELALVAPYLVALPVESEALRELVGEHWGESWGVFLHASMSFRDVRRQLRRLLRAELDDGMRVLFRFYDPRVLRAYLPACDVSDAETFYGPLSAFVCEGRRGRSVLRFRRGGDGVVTERVDLPETEFQTEDAVR